MDECWSVALRDSLVASGDVLLAVSPSAVGKLEIMVNLSDPVSYTHLTLPTT